MSIYEQNVRYISECHRCPQLHLELSNRLVDKNEKQKSEKDSGQLSVYYESEIDCHTLIERQKYNHHELEKEIEKYTTEQLSKNGRSLLGVFSNYYNNYRYANYIPGKNSSELRKLFISFILNLI